MKFARFRIPRGLLLACMLSLAFMLLSFARLAGDSQSTMFDHAAFKAVFEGPILGTRLATFIGWFVIWLTMLHLALGLACWLLAQVTRRAWPAAATTDIRKLVAIWFAGTAAWLLIWNSGNYPLTSIGRSYAGIAGVGIAGLPLHAWLTLLYAGVVLVTLGQAARRTLLAASPRTRMLTAGAAGALAIAVVSARFLPVATVPAAPDDKPNIIFLGVDSLRYDEVLRGAQYSNTPNIDSFLKDAVRFDNAMTPLARTYPSWVSVLTGKHPHTTGAFLNLLPPGEVRLGQTLPALLRQHGYRTVYAIDEVRFSNIDVTYGFDQAVTPPIGSSDFIIGSASDTPLLNLIGATRLGKWLFPHSYANRGANLTYEPDTFVARVRDDVEYSSPMFLAVHLTLPHWPYTWRNVPRHLRGDDPARPGFYQAAVRRADQQFGEILRHFEARGLLRNAIVITFSDHGESFHAHTDTLVPFADPTLAGLRATPSWGHGTTVLTPHQYRVFLAMRGFGKARALFRHPPGNTSLAVSVEDITPTALDLLNIRTTDEYDGISLLPALRAESEFAARHAHRMRFTETEFNPLNLFNMTDDVTVVNVQTVTEVMNYYRVDPVTDRVEMKRHFLDTLRRNRQFAAVGWSQMLAVFPSPRERSFTFLVVDLAGSKPRKLESSEDFTRDEEVHALWKQMCARYGDILDDGAQATKCSPARVAATVPTP